MSRLFAAAIVVLLGGVAVATPIRIPVDQANSSVTVTLCIAGRCDSDTSPVTGDTWLKLATVENPTSLQLYDFTFALTQTLQFNISWSFLGSFAATGNSITLLYATPFVPQPPTPVSAGAFACTSVPAITTGTVSYVATGVPCAALQGAGKPCSDSVNMADQGTQTGDMGGTASVNPARVVTFVVQPNFSGPLDPENPSLGTISVAGTVRGSVVVPLRGDVNLDGVVDGRDVRAFTGVLLQPGSFTWQERFAVDMNDDDVFDAADTVLFIEALVGLE